VLPIVVNGAPHVCRDERATVADLMRELALTGKRVAVEKNGEIVPRSRYGLSPLAAGDRLEIIVAVGGG
jgi:sulfur carrier protein